MNSAIRAGLVILTMFAIALEAGAQSAGNRVALSNGAIVALSQDRRSATATVLGRERDLVGPTESAFLSLNALQDRRGNTVGVSVIENWEDGYFFTVYLISGADLVRTADFSSPSPNLGVADWDGDGDLDFSVPGASGLAGLFFGEPGERIVVYELDRGGVYRSSVSCFPLLAQSLENEVASLEGEHRSEVSASRRMRLAGVDLSARDMARVPEFIEELRASIRRRCDRERVRR